MEDHIHAKHPYVSLTDYVLLWKIGNMECKAMKLKWDERNKVKKTRKSKSKAKIPLEVSAAHSSCLTLSQL